MVHLTHIAQRRTRPRPFPAASYSHRTTYSPKSKATAAEGEMAAAEENREMMGVAVGEKGRATACKEMGTVGATEEEKGEAAAGKEKEATEEKEEKGAAAGNEEKGEEEEAITTVEDKVENGSASAKKKAEAEDTEEMFTWFSEIALSEKGAAAAEGERRERRRFRRTKGQTPEKKGAMVETAEEVAGEKETFFFRTRGNVVFLKSSDGMLFRMLEEAARVSVHLADTIDQGYANISLPDINARTLFTVIEYCNKHGANEGSRSNPEALKEWDRELIDGLSQEAVYDLILAANSLHIKGLVDVACQKVADMVKGKTPEQMHEIEKEAVFEWFSEIGFSEKGTEAAEGKRRAPRRFRRTKGQLPEKKGMIAEETEEVAGEKETFFFRASGKMIKLKSSDGMLFKVSEEAARLSVLLADMIDEGCAGSIIALANIDARALATVIEYCNKHADTATAKPGADEGSSSSSEASGKGLKEWDCKLIDALSMDALYDLINATNFLHVKGLLEAACQKVADMIKGKTAEEMRKMFHITNDFTKEEEEEMRKESPWAFE